MRELSSVKAEEMMKMNAIEQTLWNANLIL